MKAFFTLFFYLALSAVAIYLGSSLPPRVVEEPSTIVKEVGEKAIPHIGRIEVLNGCGKSGVADKVSKLLRDNQFDVKNSANARSWNYVNSIVIARDTNMLIAQEVARLLQCDEPILLRNEQEAYDVTVIIGHNYKEIPYGK